MGAEILPGSAESPHTHFSPPAQAQSQPCAGGEKSTAFLHLPLRGFYHKIRFVPWGWDPHTLKGLSSAQLVPKAEPSAWLFLWDNLVFAVVKDKISSLNNMKNVSFPSHHLPRRVTSPLRTLTLAGFCEARGSISFLA